MNFIEWKKGLASVGSLVLITILISTCGGGGDGDVASVAPGTSGVTTEQAQSAAVDNTIDNLRSGTDTLTSLASDSDAMRDLSSAFGLQLPSGDTTSSEEGDVVDAFGEIMSAFITDLSVTTSRSGERITVDPSPSKVCNEVAEALGVTAENLDGCEQIVDRMNAEIVIQDQDRGTVTFNFDGNTLLTVIYSPNTVTYDIDLSGLAQGIQGISAITNPGEPLQLPDTIEGSIAIILEELGTEHGRITLAITETIDIEGTVNDGTSQAQQVSVNLAPTSRLFSLEANGVSREATAEIGLAEVMAMFPVEDSFDNAFPATLDLAGITLRADLTNNGKILTISNVALAAPTGEVLRALTNPGLSLNINNQSAIEMALATFGFTVDGLNDTLTIDRAFDFDLVVNDVLGIIETAGMFAMDMPANTVLSPVGPEDDGTLKVISGGPVTAFGDGDFMTNLNAAIGTCFDQQLETVACP